MADPISSEDRSLPIDDIVYEFERAFRSGAAPRIEDHLSGEGLDRWHLLTELIHSELELRIGNGDRAELAEYLVRYPALACLPHELAPILETQVRLLAQAGEEPDLKEYEERYAVLGGLVRDVFKRVGTAPPEVPGYEILEKLAQGGMGVVYKARQLLLRREVALKLIRYDRRDGALGDRFKARFRREAAAVAAVNHPHVVQVFDSGQSDDDLFIAMELVDGLSLQKRLDTIGVLDPRAAAELVEKVARALAAVHARKIVHRDLKPDNILLTAAGEPKVVDFGLACPAEISDGRTKAGVVLGTPEYMSPEQAVASGEEPTPLADVYGLGAVLYACLTGRPPFPRESLLVTLEKVRTQLAPPVCDVRSDCPADLEAICAKCLEKVPARRYASAEALADDLRRWLDGRPTVARSAGRAEKAWKWTRRNKGLTATVSVVFLALTTGAGLAIWQADKAWRAEAAERVRSGELTRSEIAERTRSGELAGALSKVTKAEQEAQTRADQLAESQKQTQEKANDLADQLKESRRLADLGKLREANAAFENNQVQLARDILNEVSPENRCIAWGLLHREFEGSLLTLIGHTNHVTSVAASADGSRVVTGSADNTARVWDARTGKTLHTLKGHTSVVTSVAVSADGSRVVTGSADHTARVWNARTGKTLLTLTDNMGVVTSVAFSADGSRVVTGGSESAEDLTRVWNARTGQRLHALKSHRGARMCVAVSAGGELVASGWNDNEATMWDVRTVQRTSSFRGHTASVRGVALSSDGSWVVTGSDDHTARVWDARTGKTLLKFPTNGGQWESGVNSEH